MSDDQSPSQRTEVQKPRSFQWRMIPVTVRCFIGLTEFLAGFGMPLFAIFYNMQHGWVVVDLVDPRATPWALCLFNLSIWQIHFWMGVVTTVSSWAWLRGRWYIASGTMLLMPLLVLLMRTMLTWHYEIR